MHPQQQILFTPGPLLTSQSVKEACLIDMGSRDPKFIQIIDEIRFRLLALANAPQDRYAAVLLQGSGSYGLEAVLQTAVNKKLHKILLLSNGAYGERQARMMDLLGIKYEKIAYDENQKVRIEDIIARVESDPTITHVSMVHSETTSGIINDIDFMDKLSRKVVFLLDAVSSFGAYEIDVPKLQIDFLVSTSNKNIQGLPGFAFVISKLETLNQSQGNAASLVLDLYDQEQQMRKTKQFRYTPPTHVVRAFLQALKEHEEEGSTAGRFKRYSALQQYVSRELQTMGFKLYVQPEDQGCIITTFMLPRDERFNFEDFYENLARQNLVIYPGKLTKVQTFRIGSIGALQMEHMELLVGAIKKYFEERGLQI